MESSRYWQNLGEVVDKKFINGQEKRGLFLERQPEEKGGCEKIVYDGKLMSVDVYLSLPTFIRRGITIAV